MYVNSGYLHHSRVDFKDTTRPLTVGSCGTYCLHRHPVLPTHWPRGRLDYQLLYVSKGKTHFWFGGKEEVVTAGSMVLYLPREEQRYVYYAAEHPEVFWVHFTGYDVKNILSYYGFSPKQRVYHTGTLPEFKWLYQRMIQELQLCRPLYEEFLASLLNDLFLLIRRAISQEPSCLPGLRGDIAEAVSWFGENYNKKLSVEHYAEEHHISVNHFIRSFKQYTGMTPGQYITSVRITNAQSLLERGDYNIREIAAIVGYEDALYFSRVFHRQVGMSPTEYRKAMEGDET